MKPAKSVPPSPAETSCTLSVHAQPGASRDEVREWTGEAWRVRVRAPALDGRANEALCEVLAAALGLRANALEVAHGAKGRRKLIRVRGLTAEQATERLTRTANPAAS